MPECGHDDAHTPKRQTMQTVPDLFVVHGIEAQDALGEVDCHAEAGALGVTVRHAHLAETGDALIGVDADEHGVPRHIADGDLRRNRGLLEASDDLDARDFHEMLPSLRSVIHRAQQLAGVFFAHLDGVRRGAHVREHLVRQLVEMRLKLLLVGDDLLIATGTP